MKSLEKRLFNFKPISDGEIGKFVPYCNFKYHQGIPRGDTYKKCEERKCHHYLKLYLVHDFNQKV
jgi:hypothetical protein